MFLCLVVCDVIFSSTAIWRSCFVGAHTHTMAQWQEKSRTWEPRVQPRGSAEPRVLGLRSLAECDERYRVLAEFLCLISKKGCSAAILAQGTGFWFGVGFGVDSGFGSVLGSGFASLSGSATKDQGPRFENC